MPRCVWRVNTPPLRAMSGKMCPGRCRSAAVPLKTSSIVPDRSKAEIPVVTPCAGVPSTEMVNAVPCGLVAGDHGGQRELSCPIAGQRQADQSTAVGAHEVDHFRRRMIGRRHKVTLVLAILVVHDNDHLAPSDRGDRL
jgi:hypothetical protein